MAVIKLIEETTDISKLTMRHMNWDLVIYDRPYYVVAIEDYIHSIGSRWGENNFWAYPRDEEPTYHNLIEFGCDSPVAWGIEYKQQNSINYKWGEGESRTCGVTTITRNGKKFYDILGGRHYSIPKALTLISQLDEHPLELQSIDWDKKMIGRKVWWRSEPAIITHYCEGQAAIILEPDGIDEFTVPNEFIEEEPDYYCDGDCKTSIFDQHIWWFRE